MNDPQNPKVKVDLKMRRIFLKYASFEPVNSDHLLKPSVEWKPDVNMHINIDIHAVEKLQEVTLTAKITVKNQSKTMYLAEVKEAGLFEIAEHLDDKGRRRVLTTLCPQILFPFAREEIAHLVVQGGFPQLLLMPVDFAALFRGQEKQDGPVNLKPSSISHSTH